MFIITRAATVRETRVMDLWSRPGYYAVIKMAATIVKFSEYLKTNFQRLNYSLQSQNTVGIDIWSTLLV